MLSLQGAQSLSRRIWSGGLSVASGVYAMRAAETSAARGGGLPSPLAWVPLISGIMLVIPALPPIIMALAAPPKAVDG